MQGSWLDSLPSRERERIRQRLRSPEAYEALRERVKGPEDLEKELQRGERLAELHFALETEPELQKKLKTAIGEDIKEQGIEAVLDARWASPDARNAVLQGNFAVAVQSHPRTHEDAVVAVPEGNVQEKLPVKPSFSDRYAAQLLSGGGGGASAPA